VKVKVLSSKEISGLRFQACYNPSANYEILCLIATIDALRDVLYDNREAKIYVDTAC
jgi:hypothetical protein